MTAVVGILANNYFDLSLEIKILSFYIVKSYFHLLPGH